MPETEDCPLCDGDDQECRYCGVPRIKMPETERRKAAEEMKTRARENMREIYRNSGHGFSAADIEKLCDDSSQEINQWAAFAAKEADSALLARSTSGGRRKGMDEETAEKMYQVRQSTGQFDSRNLGA